MDTPWVEGPQRAPRPDAEGAQAQPEPARPEPPRLASAVRIPLAFHGSGSEYFRIWVVNLLLTLLTLGLYSAWAKVRKAQWFARHTELAGDRFDFHGDPKRILLGRVLAVGLVVLWAHAFDLGLAFGLAVLAALFVLAPPLFASAQRFRLANTSWRGLRFGFDVPRRRVYAVCVPLLLFWTLGTVLQAAGAHPGAVAAAGGVLVLGFPWAHARLKQMQHEHARLGTQRFSFAPAGKAFYGLYGVAFLLAFLGGIFAAVAAPAVQRFLPKGSALQVMALVGIFALVAMVWLAAWPTFAARMQRIVWSRTRWGAVRFAGEMAAGKLFVLMLKQALLVLITFGLYWPFAAVAIARYRITSVVVESDDPLADVMTTVPTAPSRQAVGDAAADFFGLDLGW